MSTDRPVVYVDLKRSRIARALLRPQPWYWVAKNAANQKRLARSTERYTNRQDCLDAIDQLFNAETIVYLREAEHGNMVLRLVDPPGSFTSAPTTADVFPAHGDFDRG